MNPPKCDELDYIHFLIAAQKVFTCTEAARSQPKSRKERPPAHDAFTRLLTREPPDTGALWEEAKTLIEPERGVLVMDDTTLDKPYAKKIDLVHRHWSGKHGRVVSGINLSTLLWTDTQALVPTDFRVYDKPRDGLSKNEHFRAMLSTAKERGFSPGYVLFDSWYGSLENLKSVRGHGWGSGYVGSRAIGSSIRTGRAMQRSGRLRLPPRRADSASQGLRDGQGISDSRKGRRRGILLGE